ncbi:hypothetical protein DICPUDRAFT_92046 [Dictyostelium purpureum]|uniref:Polymerase nucleotidyl transferase domain-containing protein n=1 Tax=Dictyostelium purpureum TaxID=5786 RepID=F0ZL45_DICPU|nr:uncharacterized protein DICPUDRAFT_92046 [Dictyostelium purpureum]EGC35343.1 hypothetical protein DICPUDRAFT_92046 [Dictyostelium purpureum]|eukprot:XP_003288150.1 hypothetical protein DICPUDRAFT_92046 [Dictyostelium purpureum]
MESILDIENNININNNNYNINIDNKNKNFIKEINSTFKDLKNYCKNDSLLYIFYRLIQADYNFYQQCLGIFEGIVGIHFKSFILIPRGSFATKTGLKSTIDLDLDFILPREFVKPEDLNSTLDFPLLLIEINQIISKTATNKQITIKSINKNITRSLKYVFTVEGIEVSVDLFPKLVSIEGKLVCPSHFKDETGNRYWEYSNFISEIEKPQFKNFK